MVLPPVIAIDKHTDAGLRDARASLVNVRATLTSQLSYAEAALAEAEAQLNGLRKLKGFLDTFEETVRAEQQRRESAAPKI